MQVKAIEDFIDLGQIEEVINMVQDEIELCGHYIGKSDICPINVPLDLVFTEGKGWEAVAEAKQHATEWYELKMEDLYHAGLDSKVGAPTAATQQQTKQNIEFCND